ncbi:hypothetical protein DFJ74DRAFT_86391 [Hyaloraphidium curvatum]|nr:hypothetical protein DFJ74DRAFT_86391 [Hyaloraphidium curvatum]
MEPPNAGQLDIPERAEEAVGAAGAAASPSDAPEPPLLPVPAVATLPPEIRNAIIKALMSHGDRGSVSRFSRASKACYRAFYPLLLRDITFEPGWARGARLEQFLDGVAGPQKYALVKRLKLHHSICFDDPRHGTRIWDLLKSCLPHLNSLELVGPTAFLSVAWKLVLAANVQQLEELSFVGGWKGPSSGQALPRCVRRLTVVPEDYSSLHQIVVMVDRASDLEDFHIKGLSLVGIEDEFGPFEHAKRVLRSCFFKEALVRLPAWLTGLRVLRIPRQLTGLAFRVRASDPRFQLPPSLKELRLEQVQLTMTEDRFDAVRKVLKASNLESIYVRVAWNSQRTDSAVKELAFWRSIDIARIDCHWA